MSLSALVITRNEEANLADCLASLAWAEEVVVVDAASTDRTREIASRYTAKVFSKEWEGYAVARRYALSKCTCDWVLSVDADERVTDELRREIEDVLRRPEHQGYLIPRKAFFLGRWIKHCGWYPGHVLRLVRRDRARVTERRVHEGLRVDGTAGTSRRRSCITPIARFRPISPGSTLTPPWRPRTYTSRAGRPGSPT